MTKFPNFRMSEGGGVIKLDLCMVFIIKFVVKYVVKHHAMKNKIKTYT